MSDLDERIAATPAPRVTQDDLNAVIVSEAYHRLTPTLTICVLTLENGFEVTGFSACASPENYDQGIGQELALKDATNKVWGYEAYLLKQELWHHEVGTGANRYNERVNVWYAKNDCRTQLGETLLNQCAVGYPVSHNDYEAQERRFRALDHAVNMAAHCQGMTPNEVLDVATQFAQYLNGSVPITQDDLPPPPPPQTDRDKIMQAAAQHSTLNNPQRSTRHR